MCREHDCDKTSILHRESNPRSQSAKTMKEAMGIRTLLRIRISLKNFVLLFARVNTVTTNKVQGSIKDWTNKVSDTIYWNRLINCLLHSEVRHRTRTGSTPPMCQQTMHPTSPIHTKLGTKSTIAGNVMDPPPRQAQTHPHGYVSSSSSSLLPPHEQLYANSHSSLREVM
jgi:hypothetical protein